MITEQQKLKLAELKKIAQERSYKKGWVFYRLKDEFGYEATEELMKMYDDIKVQAQVQQAEQKPVEIKKLELVSNIATKIELKDFQKIGVSFAIQNQGRALIADEMGLGKTAQAIAYLSTTKHLPALIICPAVLKENWKREIAKFSDMTSEILSGRKNETLPDVDCLIVNYDVIEANKKILSEKRFSTIVLDESHYIKNMKAKRTKTILELSQKIEHRLLLTGTPILNRPIELYPQLQVLGADWIGGYWRYAKRYADAQEGRWGWDVSGASNIDELNSKLCNSVMIRRKKDEVLKELPEKCRQTIPVSLNGKTGEYKEAVKELRKAIAEYKKSQEQMNGTEQARNAESKLKNAKLRGYLMHEIEKLKQLTFKYKYEKALEFITSTLEQQKQIVVFITHHFASDMLVESLTAAKISCAVIDGRQELDARQKSVDEFQAGNIQVLVCSIRAAGVGLTLTASSTVIFLEYDWNPGVHNQAEDRCHRIGQKNSVNIYYLLAIDTIEEKLAEIIDAKRDVTEIVQSDEHDAGILESIIDCI